MDPSAAVIMILLAFPTFDPAKVQEMVDAQEAFEPEPPQAPVGPDGEPIVPLAPGAVAGDEPDKPPKTPAKPGKKPAFGKPKSDVDALVEELKDQGFKEDSAKALARLAYGDET